MQYSSEAYWVVAFYQLHLLWVHLYKLLTQVVIILKPTKGVGLNILQPSHAQGAGGSCFFSCPSLSQRLEYSLDPFILPRKPYVHL